MWKTIRIIYGVCSLVWFISAGLLRILGDIDFIVERIQNPGWVGMMLNWINSSPTILNIVILMSGIGVLIWAIRKPQTKNKHDDEIEFGEPLEIPQNTKCYLKLLTNQQLFEVVQNLTLKLRQLEQEYKQKER